MAESVSGFSLSTPSLVEQSIGSQLTKVRPMRKTAADLEVEKMLYFMLPRRTCEQIVPEVLRLKKQKRNKQEHRLHIYKKLMKRNRVLRLNEVMQHLIEFDKSEAIIPHGETSKKLYRSIADSRDFDLYGRKMSKQKMTANVETEMKLLAEKMGVEYTQNNVVSDNVNVVDIFGDQTVFLKAPSLMTAKWRVGVEDTSHAPVGFSNNPTQPIRSQGNEQFYSWDGEWMNGKMHGWGTYLYEDKHTYKGQMQKNRYHGEGISLYPNDNHYSGQYVDGKYEGRGKLNLFGGSVYEGDFLVGKRHGKGMLSLACGLEYEGDWLDGRPHGRGIMRSNASKWAWEGHFDKGSISGTGVLIAPNKDRIAKIFHPGHDEEILLPKAVQMHLDEVQYLEESEKRRSDELFGEIRGKMLTNYVNLVRSNLEEERNREKKTKRLEAMEKLKEQKAKLHEARLNALAGVE